MTQRDRILGVVAVLSAIGLYLLLGQPGMAGQPIAQRTAELAQKAPQDLNVDEWMARAQALSVEHPDDPEPHFMVAVALVRMGRDDDALRAYQSALRRDTDYVPALTGLADSLVRLSGGDISADAARLYAQAYRLDSGQVRAGFLVGVQQWQNGAPEMARAVWNDMAAAFPPGSPDAEGFNALVAAFIENQPAE